MRGLTLIATLILTLVMGISLVLAVEPDEVLDDPILEARAREISKEVRCLVCQNEPIDSSNAELAKELRIVVRERLVAGDSDADVKTYLSSRYGDFVLFRPPFKTSTLLLWFGPLLIFIIGVVGIVFFFRGNRGTKLAAPLSVEEQDKLQQLLKGTQTSSQNGRHDNHRQNDHSQDNQGEPS